MGTLRFFLAVSIVVAHAGPVFGVSLADPRVAIQMFYLMSGFSMAMVWEGRYAASRRPALTFFRSRALRIYPLYFVVLILTVLLSIYAWLALDRHPISTAIQHPIRGLGGVWICLQQLILVGMESHFFAQRAADGTLAFCANFHEGLRPELHYYMFVPQAWMLSLQLVFYLLVPWLLPRPRLTVAILALSLAARAAGWACGLNADPWTHRFLPFEVAVFLLGVFSYRLYRRLRANRSDRLSRPALTWGSGAVLLGLVLAVPLLRPTFGEIAYWLPLLGTWISLPFLFQATGKNRTDRLLGDLSYPIYISHLLVMWIGELVLGIPLKALVYFAIPATLAASLALLRLQTRIDAYRHSLSNAA